MFHCKESRAEISQCKLRYFWECLLFRFLSTLQCGIDVVLCDNVILKMVADNYCCIMPDDVEDVQWLLLYDGWQLLLQNYCYTIIVQQSLTTIVAQWCWRFLMPGRKCKVDLSSRERWILQLGTKQSIQVNTLDLVMMMIQQKENEEKHCSSQLVSRHF